MEGYRDEGEELALEELIAVIGKESFDSDFQEAKQRIEKYALGMSLDMEEWPDLPDKFADSDIEVGSVKVHSAIGEPSGPRVVRVSFWASQEICNKAQHLVSCDVEYKWEFEYPGKEFGVPWSSG